MSVNEQALAAGARAARFIEPNLYQTPHNPERYYTSVAQEILNAAMPHIREQIAEEINNIEEPPPSDQERRYIDGWNDATSYAAYIAKGKP